MHRKNSWHRWTMGILLSLLVLHGCTPGKRPVESQETAAIGGPTSADDPDSGPPTVEKPSPPDTDAPVDEVPAPPGPVAPVDDDPAPAVPQEPATLVPNARVGAAPAAQGPDPVEDKLGNRPSRPPPNTPETIQIIRSLPAWEPEANRLFARQRPVVLIVICEDYGPNHPAAKTAPTCGLELAERLAHCGYDVKVVVGLPGGVDPERHWTLGNACRRIREINQTLEARNTEEKIPRGLRGKIAPLKPLARPETFTDGPSLLESIERWLSQTHNVENVAFENGIVLGGVRGRVPAAKKLPGDAPPAGAQPNGQLILDGRPPFAAMYFRGHGAAHEQTDLFYTPEDVRNEVIALRDVVQVQRVAAIAAKKFHAPLWICTDMCRTKEPMQFRTANRGKLKEAAGEPIGPRELLNLKLVPKKHRHFVQEVERLREKARPGVGLFQEEHVQNATILFPDILRRDIADQEDRSMGYYLAEALQMAKASGDAGLEFLLSKQKSLTLCQCFEFPHKELVRKSSGHMMPVLDPGPIHIHQVVASAVRGFNYPRAQMDILANNIKVNPRLKQFTVSENGDEKVKILRTQQTFNDDFRAFFDLEDAFDLDPGRKQKLVLHVSGQAAMPNTKIQFVVGAYYGWGDLLTTRFEDFSSADSVVNPVPCDGTGYFRETPLDRETDVPRELKHLEVQACPTDPEGSWPLGASLTLLGAYLVPMECGIEELKAEIQVQRKILHDQNVIDQWWCTTPLDPGKGGGVSASFHGDGEDEIGIVMSNAAANRPMWGVTGGLYPRRQLERKKSRLGLRVSGGSDADEQAEIYICLYSGNRILAAHRASYREATKGVKISILESGVVDELAVAAEGLSSLRIEQLTLSNAGDR